MAKFIKKCSYTMYGSLVRGWGLFDYDEKNRLVWYDFAGDYHVLKKRFNLNHFRTGYDLNSVERLKLTFGWP
jgi:hypothetical protein